jgi:hypothetical protein
MLPIKPQHQYHAAVAAFLPFLNAGSDADEPDSKPSSTVTGTAECSSGLPVSKSSKYARHIAAHLTNFNQISPASCMASDLCSY